MRKYFRKLLSINIVALFFYSSCTQFSGIQSPSITGKIVGAAGQKIILEELTVKELLVLDSVVADANDEFSFLANPRETTFYRLRFKDGNVMTVVVNPDELLNITASADSFPPDYQVKGNTDSEILQEYFSQTHQRQLNFDGLREDFFNSTHLSDFPLIKDQIDKELEQLISDQRNFTIQTIQNNPGSFSSLLLLNQRFANQLLIDPAVNLRLFEIIDSALIKKYPQNSHVLEHHRRVTEFRQKLEEQRLIDEKLSLGQPIPDITLQDISGKARKISELRGEPALIYFWVSWSPPCRAANHQLKELYATFHPKGFEIFAISLDHQQRFWADAIKVDELPWINVSDLRGTNSPVARLFNLPENLPFYFLMDAEGIIIARTEKFGEIRDAVREYFDR